MTKLLGKAFEQASNLPTKDQDELARWILEELASEERWNRAFANSQDEPRSSQPRYAKNAGKGE